MFRVWKMGHLATYARALWLWWSLVCWISAAIHKKWCRSKYFVQSSHATGENLPHNISQLLQYIYIYTYIYTLIFTYYHTHIHVCVYIYGVASKFGYGSARGDPDVWNGLDHLRFGMDRGYGSACGFRVWIGALYFDSQPYIMLCSNFGEKVTSVTFQLDCHNPEAWAGGGVSFAPWRSERPW